MRPVRTLLCALVLVHCAFAAEQPAIGFNQSIRPILSDNCFACHGPDAGHRKGKLRLDLRDAAVDRKAIVPGKPDESELIKRIFTNDADDLMPPADSHKVLTTAQKHLLKNWIAQGAVYEGHWSYISPVKPATPAGRNGIDHLVQERLKTASLKPSARADARTLIRRLYFDLVGLPPTPEQVETFESDSSPGAYAQLVEKLLASPEYGERMAIPWLDVVRFADTIGYHSDTPRNIWPYRDYVIRAFNNNKPFDQFTLEQLAGDLLPNPTTEQKVASAFNRLLLSTEEGGAQPKDYEARMLTDRVRAVGTVWMGQTLGCAACHDHKFDPIAQKDFYAMGAFFADITEPIIGKREDGMLVTNEEQGGQLKQLEKRLAQLQQEFDAAKPELEEAFARWEKEQLAPLSALLKEEIASVLRIPAEKRKPKQKEMLFGHFKSVAPELAGLRTSIADARKQKDDFTGTIPRCLVSVSSEKPRTIRVLPRGDFLNESGEIVQPALPHFLASAPAPDKKLTRLDLARWLISRENPLTARVTMNRLWKQFFGTGLSKVLDDLGAQGETPPNQALLDFLACEFMDSGWDFKHMVRLIVTSDTYQQSSTASPELRARDPDNRYLAAQSRWRLEAELVRDNALAVSGLLVRKLGGPSANPYQPDGYWENLNFPVRSYHASRDENQYRRGLYTW
ncbi:MAG: PSD1 and planctomycete cytochrome C domain-containing protein, partial [Limisphaerales bacterium]